MDTIYHLAIPHPLPTPEETLDLLARMPPDAQGHITWSIDGYDQDPRELWEIPEVITFAKAVLFGLEPSPDHARATRVLGSLLDEFEDPQGMAKDFSGRYAFLSIAAHDMVMIPPDRPTDTWKRDVSGLMYLYTTIQERGLDAV